MPSITNTIWIFILIACSLSAQNLDKIGKDDMLKVNGGLNYSSVLYNANGITNRRQPFTWFLNGNVSLSFLDVNLPFTFNYSNNQMAYTQPFNIQSFNPTYKWIKGYAGITSMNFSQYTLAGHIFAGAGIELSPKNFKIQAMYGRFKKAVEFDAVNNSDINMSYKRMGYGASLAYEKKGHGIKLIYFSAKDESQSLQFIPINTLVTPMENTVLSLEGKTILFQKINIQAEYALSGLTRNSTSPIDLNSKPTNKMPLIFQPNSTSQFFSAFKSSVGYSLKPFTINLNYERVEPDYKTLGAYYFNNDLENITLAPSVNLLQGKLNLALNTGIQKNNLDNSKLSTTKRWVGSINANYNPNKHWNFTTSYSNFSTFTKQRPQDDPFYKNTLDTLNFYQLSQNALGTVSYNFGKTKTRQNTMYMINYLVTGQNQGAIQDPAFFGTSSLTRIPSRIINTNLSHNISFIQSKITLGVAVNLNYSEMLSTSTYFVGPSLNVGKAILNNTFRVNAGITYNQVITNENNGNQILNSRLTLNYNPKLKSQKFGRVGFNSSVIYTQKLQNQNTTSAFNEFTGNLGLNYSF